MLFDRLRAALRAFRAPGGHLPAPDTLEGLAGRVAALEDIQTRRELEWAETKSALDRMLKRAAALDQRGARAERRPGRAAPEQGPAARAHARERLPRERGVTGGPVQLRRQSGEGNRAPSGRSGEARSRRAAEWPHPFAPRRHRRANPWGPPTREVTDGPFSAEAENWATADLEGEIGDSSGDSAHAERHSDSPHHHSAAPLTGDAGGSNRDPERRSVPPDGRARRREDRERWAEAEAAAACLRYLANELAHVQTELAAVGAQKAASEIRLASVAQKVSRAWSSASEAARGLTRVLRR